MCEVNEIVYNNAEGKSDFFTKENAFMLKARIFTLNETLIYFLKENWIFLGNKVTFYFGILKKMIMLRTDIFMHKRGSFNAFNLLN